MQNYFKKFEKLILVIILLCSISALFLACYALYQKEHISTKWMGTSGLLFTIAGLFQLEVSNFFTELINSIKNEEKIPSYIVREIIDNPDTPIKTSLRNYLFFNPKTGLWLTVLGTSVQVIAIWIGN